MTTTEQLFAGLNRLQNDLVKARRAAMAAEYRKADDAVELAQEVATIRSEIAKTRSMLLHPNRGVIRTTPETPLPVPARHVTAGDRTAEFSVSGTRRIPNDRGIEFMLNYPEKPGSTYLVVREEDLDSRVFLVTKRGDDYSPSRRNEALGLPEGTDRPIPGAIAEPLAMYPEGTLISEVRHFDRGQHISFHCPEHPETGRFTSKEPGASSWFPQSQSAYGCPRDCQVGLADHVVSHDYFPTRNG